MSRRTRRPASLAANCHQQVQDAELNAQGFKTSAESEATEESETQDNSRRFSLHELIQDEATVDGEKDAATGGGHEEDPALVHGVAEAAAVGVEKPEQVVRRRVIGMMRRYVRVRSIKTKHDLLEKNAASIC
ncbi:hypothetical protein HU200_060883 [Digitaria exilis]|uniref:Uncharacterized protein n=1 Tax=Digitaria exilis TaxID=1010633 RepID=A0A835DYH1_9POAL|nr:hypothetical protein HU200_060883 [Digitaria exilis]